MDEADMTQERMEKELALRLKVRRPVLPQTGHCHNCDDGLENGSLLFCNSDCRDDWQKRQKNRP